MRNVVRIFWWIERYIPIVSCYSILMHYKIFREALLLNPFYRFWSRIERMHNKVESLNQCYIERNVFSNSKRIHDCIGVNISNNNIPAPIFRTKFYLVTFTIHSGEKILA